MFFLFKTTKEWRKKGDVWVLNKRSLIQTLKEMHCLTNLPALRPTKANLCSSRWPLGEKISVCVYKCKSVWEGVKDASKETDCPLFQLVKLCENQHIRTHSQAFSPACTCTKTDLGIIIRGAKINDSLLSFLDNSLIISQASRLADKSS